MSKIFSLDSSVVLILIHSRLFALSGYLDNPHGNDFRFIFSLFLYMSYLTTTFTVSSPTVTRTIPAGTAIVALSEVTTVSANGIPNKLRT